MLRNISGPTPVNKEQMPYGYCSLYFVLQKNKA